MIIKENINGIYRKREATEKEYTPIRAERQAMRDRINELEQEVK